MLILQYNVVNVINCLLHNITLITLITEGFSKILSLRVSKTQVKDRKYILKVITLFPLKMCKKNGGRRGYAFCLTFFHPYNHLPNWGIYSRKLYLYNSRVLSLHPSWSSPLLKLWRREGLMQETSHALCAVQVSTSCTALWEHSLCPNGTQISKAGQELVRGGGRLRMKGPLLEDFVLVPLS